MKATKALLTLTLCLLCASSFSQEKRPCYTKTPTGYMMVLRQGDNLEEELTKMVLNEHIPSASISGMGFVNATFGFFNAKERKYDTKDFNGVELANLVGSIAWKDGKPSLHMHGIVTDNTFQAFGGHIMKAVVGTGSVELTVVVHDKKFERVFDNGLGGNVLTVQ